MILNELKFLYFIFLLCLIVPSCAKAPIPSPKAKNGIIDINNWNFEKDGTIELAGEWEFYWNPDC